MNNRYMEKFSADTAASGKTIRNRDYFNFSKEQSTPCRYN